MNRELSNQLRTEARRRGVDVTLIRKQYIFTIFLRRAFTNVTAARWTLLGGNALLIRTGGGRFTQDIDMARADDWEDPHAVLHELTELVGEPSGEDPFRFELYKIRPHSEPGPFGYGAKTAKVHVRAHLDSVFETFTIDLTTRRHMDMPVSMVPLRAIIDHPTLHDLPAVPTTPAENHLADKICALYELHGPDGTTASTRFRDLADSVRLIHAAELDAQRLATVLQREEQRRGVSLPSRMRAPGEDWIAGFPSAARTYAEYPAEFHTLDAALAAVQACVGPLLLRERTSGTWSPQSQRWSTG